MAAWHGIRPGQAGGLLVMLALATALVSAPALGHAQTVTQITNLNFGTCEDIGGTTYTVAAAASPGTGACVGAMAAQFTVTGTPSRVARVTLSNSVTVTNGTASLTVKLTDSAGGSVCLGTTGTVTIYVGGSVKLPQAGLGASGTLVGPTTISLAYQGNKSC